MKFNSVCTDLERHQVEQNQNFAVEKMENSTGEKTKAQVPNLKAFKIARKYYAIMGVTSALAERPYPFNGRILCGFLALGSCIFSTSVFVIYEAETFVEYTQAIYICSIAVQHIFTVLIIILRVKNLFALINGCENLTNTSEFEMSQHFSSNLFC